MPNLTPTERLTLSRRLAQKLNELAASLPALERLQAAREVAEILAKLGVVTPLPGATPSAPDAVELSDDPNSENYRFKDTGYIANSRKEQAQSMIREARERGQVVLATAIDWQAIETNPRLAAETIIKSNLFGQTDWERLKAAGMEPGAGFLIDRIYASIAPRPAQDTPQARQDYAVALGTIRDRLEGCQTPKQVLAVLVEVNDELQGTQLNEEESVEYQALQDMAFAARERQEVIQRERDGAYAETQRTHGLVLGIDDKIRHRERRGWKEDPALIQARIEAKAAYDVAHTQWGQAIKATKDEYDALQEQRREAGRRRNAIMDVALARNAELNPLTRGWKSFGDKFESLLNHRRSGGSSSFLSHSINALNGRVPDWSWAEKERVVVKRATRQEIAFRLKVADHYQREGGRPVSVASTQDLKALMGARDIQSGNWVLKDPASAKFHVEQTAAAMLDLSDVLGIDAQALGLGGRLGMAFGARGTGNAGGGGAARAHYEPIHRVINLTKMGGGGTLGHEWFHAIDNMLGELTSGEVNGTLGYASAGTVRLPPGAVADAMAALGRLFRKGDRRLPERIKIGPKDKARAEFNIDRSSPNQVARLIKAAGGVDAAVIAVDQLLGGERNASNRKTWRALAAAYYLPAGTSEIVALTGPAVSNFYANAVALDGGVKGKYWSSDEEMAARAFQSYLEDSLAARGQRNDYLSVYADNVHYEDGKPYPEGEERTQLNAAFDALMQAIRQAQVFEKASSNSALLDALFPGQEEEDEALLDMLSPDQKAELYHLTGMLKTQLAIEDRVEISKRLCELLAEDSLSRAIEAAASAPAELAQVLDSCMPTIIQALLDGVGPLERLRLARELAGKVDSLGKAEAPLLKLRIAREIAVILQQLGAETAGTGRQPFAQVEPLKGGAVLIRGSDPEDIAALVREQFGKPQLVEGGVRLTKGDARIAQFIPAEVEPLASGARLEYFASGGVAVRGDFRGQSLGIAQDLRRLESAFVADHGPAEFERIFGKQAAAEDVEAFAADQTEIAERRRAHAEQADAERIDYAKRTGNWSQLSEEERSTLQAEAAALNAEFEAKEQAEWEATTGAGVSSNPRYQAYLDTLEEIVPVGRIMVQVGYMGWIQKRLADFRATGAGPMPFYGGPRDVWQQQATTFIRSWADQHLAARVKNQRQALDAEPDDGPLSESRPGRRLDDYVTDAGDLFDGAREYFRQELQGQVLPSAVGPVLVTGRSWKKLKQRLKFDELKVRLLPSIPTIITQGEARGPEPLSKARDDEFEAFYFIWKELEVGEQLVTAGVTVGVRPDGQLLYNLNHDGSPAWARFKEKADGSATPGATPQDGTTGLDEDVALLDRVELDSESINLEILSIRPRDAEPTPPPVELVEHITKGGKGKRLTGVIRSDLTKDQALAIDPYTFPKNGGWFIRERHLDSPEWLASLSGAAQAAVLPSASTAEPAERAAQREADLLANAQLQEQRRRREQVAKLRRIAQSTIDKASEGLGQNRLTNTHRRAQMAGSIITRLEAAKAIGQTLHNIADAVEEGRAQHLANVSSRAAVETLQQLLAQAKYEADKHLPYQRQVERRGRPAALEDLQHARYPRARGMGSHFRWAAKALQEKSPAGNSRLIRALQAVAADKPDWFPLRPADVELVRQAYKPLQQIGSGFDLSTEMEGIQRTERLARLGITDDRSLQVALGEFLSVTQQAAEDPIKRLELAIVGTNVGLDFFPTPKALAARMAQMAHIHDGARVLEPSAGNGNLADAAKAAGGVVDVIELSTALREILTAKGYTIAGTDFETFQPEERYDAVLMNPPFSNRRDADHIMRAFEMLAPGGYLVAIAGEGVFQGRDAKATAFREWLDDKGAEVEQLDGNTFMDRQLLATTGANARLITLIR